MASSDTVEHCVFYSLRRVAFPKNATPFGPKPILALCKLAWILRASLKEGREPGNLRLQSLVSCSAQRSLGDLSSGLQPAGNRSLRTSGTRMSF